MDDSMKIEGDLAQLARLSLLGDQEELRLFLARAVRRYRRTHSALAGRLAAELEKSNTDATQRRAARPSIDRREAALDDNPVLSILREPQLVPVRRPVFDTGVEAQVASLIAERRQTGLLDKHGLVPVSSAIFVGPPGVGKTMTARWIAAELEMPMFSLDLTAVMSSRLGQSGANLRSALDFARRNPTVLFLDEIDSIAKRRADDADIGELKRLVTIMLQELDEWPTTSLLLAATNHPELVDPAMWRRFDSVIDFPMPGSELIGESIRSSLGRDQETFETFIPALTKVLEGSSYSDIERTILSMRKAAALGAVEPEEATASIIRGGMSTLSRADRIDLAVDLARQTILSQHQIARMTSVSRETIRKHSRSTKEAEH